MHLDLRLRRCLDPADAGFVPTPLREAAVLCPIVLHAGEDHLLLTARPEAMPKHGGQIAFPGGMRRPGEAPAQTALRECCEEIGVAPHDVTVLGSLPPRESSTGILVHCVVGRLAVVPLQPDPREVTRVMRVPLRDLLDEGRWQERPPPPGAPGRQTRTSPHFDCADGLLWGLTARFVRDLAARLRTAP